MPFQITQSGNPKGGNRGIHSKGATLRNYLLEMLEHGLSTLKKDMDDMTSTERAEFTLRLGKLALPPLAPIIEPETAHLVAPPPKIIYNLHPATETTTQDDPNQDNIDQDDEADADA